jgi:hypothetical protein
MAVAPSTVSARTTDALGALVRVAHPHRLAALAAGAGLRLGRNLLAAAR